MPAVLELPTVAYCGNNSRCSLRADTADGCDPAAILVGLEDRVDPAIKDRDARADLVHEVEQIANNLPAHCSQSVRPVFEDLWDSAPRTPA